MKLLAATAAILLTVPCAVAQSMELTKADDREGRFVSEERFTGTVFLTPVFGPNMNNIGSSEVTFLAGARTAWHSHPGGQQLVITSGTGWTQVRGGERVIMKAGDVIWCPPDVDHWHGATDKTSMTHLAIFPNAEGSGVDWKDHVSDADYLGE